MLLLIAMNCCFAAALPLLKCVVGGVDPFFLVALRMLIAGACLCLYQGMRDWRAFMRPMNWPMLSLSGVLSMFFLCAAEAWALDGMSATKATLMWATLPIFTMFIGSCLGRERLLIRHVVSICAGFLGILLLMQSSGASELGMAWGVFSPLHELVMLGAIISAACGYFCTQVLVKEGYSVILINSITMSIGGVASLIAALVHTGASLVSQVVWWPLLGYLVLIIVIVNFIGLYLQTFLAQSYSATLLALSSFITPLAGVVMGIIFQADPWNAWFTSATLCIGSGLYLLYYYEMQQVKYGV